MELHAEEVGEIAKIYHELLVGQANLNRTDHEGPSGAPLEVRAARQLLNNLIRYRQVVPPEVQQYLNVDLDGLEKKCRAYIQSR